MLQTRGKFGASYAGSSLPINLNPPPQVPGLLKLKFRSLRQHLHPPRALNPKSLPITACNINQDAVRALKKISLSLSALRTKPLAKLYSARFLEGFGMSRSVKPLWCQDVRPIRRRRSNAKLLVFGSLTQHLARTRNPSSISKTRTRSETSARPSTSRIMGTGLTWGPITMRARFRDCKMFVHGCY